MDELLSERAFSSCNFEIWQDVLGFLGLVLRPGRSRPGASVSVVHSSPTITLNGISCRIEYAEPGAPPCDHPEAQIGSEAGGGGEFRIIPA